METWLKHLHRRDLQFLALVLANLVCVGGYLLAQVQTAEQPAGGWRRIDLQAVMTRIEAGDLQQHEAAWYHPAKEAAQKSARDAP